MKLEGFIEIGKLGKPHGLKGGMKVRFLFPLLEQAPFTSLFVESASRPIPHFIKQLELQSPLTGVIVLEEADSREKAALLGNKSILLPEAIAADWFDLEYGQGLSELEGFTIIHQSGTVIGVIKEILEYPAQSLAQLTYEGRQILIPLVEEQIMAIDEKAKTITLDFPEGLLLI